MPLPRLVIPDLVDKTVLITGGSTGIGAALARAFAAQGARVAIGYNESEGPAKAIVEEIKAGGGESLAVKGDVGKPADCDRIAAEAGGRFGRIDGLINNAGLMLGRVQSSEASDAHVQAVIDTTSIAARNGGGGGAVLYAAAKGFVSTLTRGQAKELIGKKIRVNAVAPGVIATPFHERYSNEKMMESMRQTIPSGRIGTAEDCVGAYLFLASEALSGYVVGQIVEVNGGQLMP